MIGRHGILVPLDGSQGAENALDMARILAPIYGARLTLVYVLDPDENAAGLESASANFRRYAEEIIGSRGLPAGTRVRTVVGSPARSLVDLAQDASVVVMASHGRGGVRAMLIGSVADKVVRSSESTVVLVPAVGPPPGIPRIIMVPLDGSSASERALPVARRLAAAFGAKLLLLGAYNPVVAADVEFGYYNVPLSLAEDTERYLRSVAGPGEETVTVDADASTAIITTANLRDVSMVVMSSSGKGLAGRLILGSTTDRVMRSLHRPLMIIRAG